jgi:hypothetical protein
MNSCCQPRHCADSGGGTHEFLRGLTVRSRPAPPSRPAAVISAPGHLTPPGPRSPAAAVSPPGPPVQVAPYLYANEILGVAGRGWLWLHPY